VSVRAMVKPNSQLMKVAQVLLKKPGVTPAKVSIMCGGPDWPTSVICGLLKLPLHSLLLGLTPMFLMTIPTTCVGAFMTAGSLSPIYSNIQSFLYLIVGGVQLVFGIGMMHYVNKTLLDPVERKLVDAVKEDVEVADLEKHRASQKHERDTVIHHLPRRMQAVQLGGTLLNLATFYMLMVFPSRLFQPFGLQDCWPPGRPGDIIPSISPLGFLALLMVAGAIFCMWFFSKWVNRQVQEQLEQKKGGADTEADPKEAPDYPEAKQKVADHNTLQSL